MLGRLKRRGFTEADRIHVRGGKTVVRAYHPAHGWMYEKIDESDEATSDAAVDAWVATANAPKERPKRVGEK